MEFQCASVCLALSLDFSQPSQFSTITFHGEPFQQTYIITITSSLTVFCHTKCIISYLMRCPPYEKCLSVRESCTTVYIYSIHCSWKKRDLANAYSWLSS